jgi:hypothetical protein
MADLNNAYGEYLSTHWEKRENPQVYDQTPFVYVHPTPKRHILGLIGGNNVSITSGNIVDAESDLRGLNIPNTFCPSRQYKPNILGNDQIVRDNVKGKQIINQSLIDLPDYQMWAYPSVPAPAPIKREVCMQPEKY